MPIAQSRLEILQIRKLLQCVYDKDYNQIQKLVENGVENLINYNEPDDGKTCLSVATTDNDYDTIKYLLELGAHPDVVDFQGRSAITIAAQFGHVESFECLAKAGADLKLPDLSGKTVLFYCISDTDRPLKCMEVALQFSVDVNIIAKDGRTALFCACETANANVDACINLLNAGADPKIEQKATGKTPLMMACASGNSLVVSKCLRLGVDPNIADRHGKTAVHYAAKSGNFKGLVGLVAFGANVDVYDDQQNNPIHYAAAGHGTCCKYLGQRGCNPKVKNANGELPRVIAKEAGAKDCIKEVRKVERSFGKIGKNNEPWSLALYDWTVENTAEITEELKTLDPESSGSVNKKEFVELLNRMKAPVTEEIVKKVLPLFDTNKDGTVDYADFLTGKKYVNKLYLMSAFDGRKKKKKKGGKGKKRKTKIPIEICVMPQHQIMRPIDGGPPIMFIPKEQYHTDLDSIKLALKRGYKVDTRDRFYKTPLMTAAHYGNLDMCMALINRGADVNAKDNFHWTPLHHAAHSGMIDVLELLLNNGSNIDAKAMNGATPLFRAIETSRFNIVDYLIKKGAKIQTENRKGDTPMDTAYYWADPRVINAVRVKVDALPPIKDKKNKSARGSSKGRRTNSPAKQAAEPAPEPEPPHRSASEIALKRAAVVLSQYSNAEVTEDISFTPHKLLVNKPDRDMLMRIKHERRQRFGWEIDFPDEFQSHFHKNLMIRVGASGLDDS